MDTLVFSAIWFCYALYHANLIVVSLNEASAGLKIALFSEAKFTTSIIL